MDIEIIGENKCICYGSGGGSYSFDKSLEHYNKLKEENSVLKKVLMETYITYSGSGASGGVISSSALKSCAAIFTSLTIEELDSLIESIDAQFVKDALIAEKAKRQD